MINYKLMSLQKGLSIDQHEVVYKISVNSWMWKKDFLNENVIYWQHVFHGHKYILCWYYRNIWHLYYPTEDVSIVRVCNFLFWVQSCNVAISSWHITLKYFDMYKHTFFYFSLFYPTYTIKIIDSKSYIEVEK